MFKDQVTEPNSSAGEAEMMSTGVSEGVLDFPYPTPILTARDRTYKLSI